MSLPIAFSFLETCPANFGCFSSIELCCQPPHVSVTLMLCFNFTFLCCNWETLPRWRAGVNAVLASCVSLFSGMTMLSCQWVNICTQLFDAFYPVLSLFMASGHVQQLVLTSWLEGEASFNNVFSFCFHFV